MSDSTAATKSRKPFLLTFVGIAACSGMLAMPILAGPGAMSLAIGLAIYGRSVPHFAGYIFGFAALALLTWVSFRQSDAMVRVLNVNAVGALNRVLGLFILAIGVNMVVKGVQDVWPTR
jgi:small neutral amino acid transporter SnatA (MarC family)